MNMDEYFGRYNFERLEYPLRTDIALQNTYTISI